MIENNGRIDVKWAVSSTNSENDFAKRKEKQEKSKSKRNVKPYNTTPIKARNFLTNSSYNGLKTKDFHNRNFIFNVFMLLTKSLNPFPAKRKFAERDSQEMMYILWEDCVPASFFKFICRMENFIYLNSNKVLYEKTAEIALRHLTEDQ